MLRAAQLPEEVPVVLDREQARRAASEELAKPIYQDARPGPVERFWSEVSELLAEVLERAAGASPGGYGGLLALLALLVVAAVAIRLKVGPLSRTDADTALFLGRPKSSRDYRAAAEKYAASGDWAAAVRERLRAVIRSLEERSLLEPRPGRTADEAAWEAGTVLPTCAEALRAAAREFDDIWYGGRSATAESNVRLRELDERVQASRPVVGSAP